MRVNEVSQRVRVFQKSLFLSCRLVASVLGCFSVVSNDAIEAQIVPDNTLGSESSRINRVNATRDSPKETLRERITGGATRGSNLFHSFREFNISEGRAAYFANPAAIQTIFSRVTGNNPSQIFGTLGVEGDANLFFINPNGIIFGPNATLDVRGSFIASTANSIAFPNGESFGATNPNAPPLLTIDVPVPIGLVFESDNSGIILNAANLETRQNLALIGAGIASSGRIQAPGGDITLATVPGAIESIVRLDGTGRYLGQTQGSGQPNLENRDIFLIGTAIDASSTGVAGNVILNSAGDVLLTFGANVNVRGAGGGSITVNAQNLDISGGSSFFAGIGEGLGAPDARAGNIEIDVAKNVKILNFTEIVNQVSTGSVGNAGDVIINTETFEGNGAFAIGSFTLGRGNAGKVILTAKDAVSLDGGGVGGGFLSLVTPTAIGNADDIVINARSLSLSNSAIVSTLTLGQGNTGNLTVNVTDSVQLIGSSDSSLGPSALSVQTVTTGKGGILTVNTKNLQIRDGARIVTTTAGTGDAGSLTVNASESIQLIGTSANGQRPSGLGAETLSTGEGGGGGTLTVNTKNLQIRDGASISTTTRGTGDAGSLTVNASESVQLIGISANGQRLSDLRAETRSTGEGGTLTVNTKNLLVRDGAFISTTTAGAGNAGDLTVNATESMQLIGTSANGQRPSALLAETLGTGNGGTLTVDTKNLLVRDGAGISTTTIGAGNAGSLTVKANESVRLIGTSAQGNIISSLVTGTIGNRNAGDLTVHTKNLLVQDGAFISTTTLGEGDAGNLTVRATESVQLIGTSANGQISSGLTAETRGTGEGGTLTIDTKNLLVRDGAGISTSTTGEGNAGSLTVKAIESVQLIGTSANSRILSRLLAETTNTGKGGTLTIDTKNLLVRDGAFISTNATGAGNAGSLTVKATESVRLISGTSAQGNILSFLLAVTDGNGNAGDLTVHTKNLLVQDGAGISTGTLSAGDAGGDAGSLTINATESIRLIGTSANERNSTPSYLSTLTLGGGDAGNLTVNAQNLLVRDGAVISTNTLGAGNAGSLNINALESVQLIGTSANGRISSSLQAATRGIGEGGTLTVDTKNLLVREGATISALTAGAKDAGNILLQVKDSIILTEDSGLFANTTEGSTGKGGDIFIYPQTLTVADGATISVNSQGEGTGGQIQLQADSLTLDNGTISAETASTDGGNLTLNVQNLLLLRNGSQISATAGTAQDFGTGGRIIINSGSIVAVPNENSDITANAFRGNGGRILIDTKSIFGIDFRQQLTPLSDITASSQAGTPGIVIINTSGIEPTRGLENLTEERINVEVAQGCQVGATARGRVSFYNVGRGGLPPSPDDFLNSPVTQEWLSLELEESKISVPEIDRNLSATEQKDNSFYLNISCGK